MLASIHPQRIFFAGILTNIMFFGAKVIYALGEAGKCRQEKGGLQ